jgi:uncharacterized protein
MHAEAHGSSRLEVIPHSECLSLLAANEVGRLAMIWEDEPLILPVNYTWDGSGVLFRTDPGTKLSASKDRPVAFEIDGLEPDTRRGWSVIVKGRGRAVGPHQMASTLGSEPEVWPWVPTAKHYWIRIDAHEISGRRIVASG